MHPPLQLAPFGTALSTGNATEGELAALGWQSETTPAYQPLFGTQVPFFSQRTERLVNIPSTLYLHFTVKRVLGSLSAPSAGLDHRPAAVNSTPSGVV